MKIKLTDEYSVEKTSNGFKMLFVSSEKKMVRNPRTQKVTESVTKEEKYYGALYQALSGFLKHYYERSNSLEEVVQRVEEAMAIINSAVTAMNSADRALVEKYKEVKVSSN